MFNRAKKRKILGGPLSAMAQLGLHYRSADTITRKQFTEISRAAAVGCREAGDHVGAKCLEAIASSLE